MTVARADSEVDLRACAASSESQSPRLESVQTESLATSRPRAPPARRRSTSRGGPMSEVVASVSTSISSISVSQKLLRASRTPSRPAMSSMWRMPRSVAGEMGLAGQRGGRPTGAPRAPALPSPASIDAEVPRADQGGRSPASSAAPIDADVLRGQSGRAFVSIDAASALRPSSAAAAAPKMRARFSVTSPIEADVITSRCFCIISLGSAAPPSVAGAGSNVTMSSRTREKFAENS
mmetsp:Transcript_28896/g.99594  ORF Transcript_28896/g.99594 Transcript_28896/m.99594 type:complete len:236 (-) Transcript_28896:9-716(-)